MPINIHCGSVAKRRNSTYRPSDSELSQVYSVLLKAPTTHESPTFLLNVSDFPYNYVRWGDTYYFVTGVSYEHNNLCSVDCVEDVLATFKDDILNTTAFVSYSSVNGSPWLADTRVPVLQSCTVTRNAVDLGIFGTDGWYIVSAIGKQGAKIFVLSKNGIRTLTNNLQPEYLDQYHNIVDDLDFDTTESAIESLTKAATQSSLLGNAFENAPACIRSALWIPFVIPSAYPREQVYLGAYDMGFDAQVADSKPITGSTSVAIPWQYSDWRRGVCEDIYLYLPMVGMINIPSSNLTHASAITINYSYTITDGNVAFQIVAGNEVIGSYGGSCSAGYAIGVNQPASVGSVATTAFNGIMKTLGVSLQTSGQSLLGGKVEAAGLAVLGAAQTIYETKNAQFTTNPSCIGGIGGGAGFGLSHNVVCFSVAHPTAIAPADMAATMGLPTMKPLKLENCAGYCQCANARVECAGHADEIDQIDTLLNAGFFIE